MSAPPTAEPRPAYIDRPEVAEVFADRLEHMRFDGSTIRMEFAVVRDDASRDGEAQQWSYTACRVVLSVYGAADLLNKMNQLRKVLLDRGVLSTGAPPPPAEF